MASLANNFRKLNEEHQRLQRQFCKINEQLTYERATILPKDGYKSEITHLQDSLHDTLAELEEVKKQLTQSTEEARELRGDLDFISTEREVLSEQVKELEQALSSEKEERKAEKESLQDLASRSQTLYEKVLTKNEKIKGLEEQVSSLQELKCSLQEQVLTLQTQIDQLKKEKNDLTIRLTSSDCEKLRQSESQLKNELNIEREKNLTLVDEIESLRERLRVADTVTCELKKQLTSTGPVSSGPGAILQPASASFSATSVSELRRELKNTHDAVASRDMFIQKLNDKYTRHRQVWEENERRANDEIKKLDAMLDRVVATISPCVGDNPSLQRLLDELTRDAQGNLTSTFV